MDRTTGTFDKFKVNFEISLACRELCRLLFDDEVVHISDNDEELSQKYKNHELGWIDDGDEILRIFTIGTCKDIVGVIILSDCSNRSDQAIKFYVNFYEIKNQTEAKIFLQAKYESGQEMKMIVLGKPDDILSFIRAHKPTTPSKQGASKTWYGLNKELGVFSGCAFILTCGFLFFNRKI